MALNKKNIPLLKPAFFKEELIENTQDFILKDARIDDFFIHSFERDMVKLKLPLPPHKKTVNDFVLILSGQMTKTIGLHTFKLQAGQFLFTPRNSITTTKNVTENLEGFYCHFSDEFIANNPSLKRGIRHSNFPDVQQLSRKEIINVQFLLERMVLLYRNSKQKCTDKKLIHSYLSTLITEISVISEEHISKNNIHTMVSRFNELVNARFKESRNVKFYADLLHISPNHMNKVIKRETGNSASEIINQLCILEAKVLLTQTNLDIGEIALELGFTDASYFSRYFKKHTTIAPTEYRKMNDLS